MLLPCVPGATTAAPPSSLSQENQLLHPGPQPTQDHKPTVRKKGPLNNGMLPVLVIVIVALVLVVVVVIFQVRTSISVGSQHCSLSSTGLRNAHSLPSSPPVNGCSREASPCIRQRQGNTSVPFGFQPWLLRPEVMPSHLAPARSK